MTTSPPHHPSAFSRSLRSTQEIHGCRRNPWMSLGSRWHACTAMQATSEVQEYAMATCAAWLRRMRRISILNFPRSWMGVDESGILGARQWISWGDEEIWSLFSEELRQRHLSMSSQGSNLSQESDCSSRALLQTVSKIVKRLNSHSEEDVSNFLDENSWVL